MIESILLFCLMRHSERKFLEYTILYEIYILLTAVVETMMKCIISFFAFSIFALLKYIASSDFSPSGLDSQIGGGTLKWLLSLYLFLSPFRSSLFRSHAIFRQDFPFVPSIPRWFLRLASTPAHPRAYHAPSYREVHNPEGLITYSSGERESRYGATHRLISPTPPAPRMGVSLSTLFHERFYPSDPIPSIRRGCRLPWPGGAETRGMPWGGPPSLPACLPFPFAPFDCAISTGMETSIEGHTKLGSSRAITFADRR